MLEKAKITEMTMLIKYKDTDIPANGPNGAGCTNGKHVDAVPFDSAFTCNCDGTQHEGENCESRKPAAAATTTIGGVCHFGVENTLNCSVKRKVEPELKERIASMSRDKLKITVNCPIEEAMTASSAVSSSNDTLILLNKKNELSGRQSSETFTGANGRLTMQFSNVDKQISALICLYGVTDTCGSLTADEKTDLTEKEVALEAKNRRKMRADAKRHLEADLRAYVGLAKDCGATIVLFTDANATKEAEDRSSGVAKESSLLNTLEDLDLLDVWPRTKGSGDGHTFHSKTIGGGRQSSRIDRFYLCQDMVDMCGGFEKITLQVAEETGGLSDAHKLLVLTLPKLTHSSDSKLFKVDRGESNRKFLLNESETAEWAGAMAKDEKLLRAMERQKVDGGILNAEKGFLVSFKGAAHALTALGVTEEEARPLKMSCINAAFEREGLKPEGDRALTGDLDKSKCCLSRIVQAKGGGGNRLRQARRVRHMLYPNLHHVGNFPKKRQVQAPPEEAALRRRPSPMAGDPCSGRARKHQYGTHLFGRSRSPHAVRTVRSS